MNALGPWTNEDYEALSWHDVHVYGFRLDSFDERNGTADLILDIDYILRWELKGEKYLFTVCQATLCFHQIFNLKFSLDYMTPTAGLCPFSLAGIEREGLEFPNGYKNYQWHLPFNWPEGTIEFEALEFTQALIGTPQVQDTQNLLPQKRLNST
ncbi:MAG: hypothetical protein V9G63_10760 [Candidatus Competibacter sp.]